VINLFLLGGGKMKVLFFSGIVKSSLERNILNEIVENGWELGIIGNKYQANYGKVKKYDCHSFDYFDISDNEYNQILSQIENIENEIGISFKRCFFGDRHLNFALTRKHVGFVIKKSPLRKMAITNPDKILTFLVGLYKFLNNVINDFKPDLVLIHSFAGAPSLMLGMLCEYKKIPYWAPLVGRIHRQDGIIYQDLFYRNKELIDIYKNILESELDKFIEGEDLSEKLEQFHLTIMDAVKNDPRGKTEDLINIIKRSPKALRETIIYYIKNKRFWPFEDRWLPSKKILEQCWKFFKRKLREKIFIDFSEQELMDMDYAYFPLHVDPEGSTICEAPVWANPVFAIELIAKMLPFKYKLLVRDHYLNVGVRPLGFYKYLSKIPGVYLVNPYGSAFSYLKNANLVFTDNGTVGWEGLILGKPVITLANAHYDITGLTYKIKNFSEMDKEILEILKNHNNLISQDALYQAKLRAYVEAERRTLIKNFKQDIKRYWQNIKNNPSEVISC